MKLAQVDRHRRRWETVGIRALVVAGIAAIVCAAIPSDVSAVSRTPFAADVLGLPPDQRIEYPAYGSTSGSKPAVKVSGVGDVNGDAREDFAVGVGGSHPAYDSRIDVSFSAATTGGADAGGFQILTTRFWYSLTSAGDVDGDGLGDVAFLGGDQVTVVFGRLDGATVDTARLGRDGFVVTGAFDSAASGNGLTMDSDGLALLGDAGADGIGALIFRTRTGATVFHPPRDAAGRRFDGSRTGPHVSLIVARDGDKLDHAFVDDLGDVDGDGRSDALVAGDTAAGGQAAYGVRTPLPNTTVTLPDAVATGGASEIRIDDATLHEAISLSDQNADGVRDMGLVGGRLRVIYTPPFGATIDADDLYAADQRGWSMNSGTSIVDIGDHSGDGVGDLALRGDMVVFPDPTRETGARVPEQRGFSFDSGNIVASIADLNGDDRRELVRVETISSTYNNGENTNDGETASVAVMVDDSAADLRIEPPDVEVSADGVVSPAVTVDPGAGSRGGSLPLHAEIELAGASGPSVTYGQPAIVAARGATRVSFEPRRLGVPVVYGGTYRMRALARNGRGVRQAGPWRSFVYDVAPPPVWGQTSDHGAGSAVAPPAARIDARIRIGTRELSLRGGHIAVPVSCRGASGSCPGTLRLSRGTLRLGSRSYSVRAGRSTTVRVRVNALALRALRGKRRVSLKLTATSKHGASAPTHSTTATRRARLR